MHPIDIDSFPDHGLYLLMPDGVRLTLTRPEIEQRMRVMLDDPDQIPPEVRAAADYKPCDSCPERFRAEICHAIMTTLPFATEIDHYVSFDNVTAVYRQPEGGGLTIRTTTMQEALQYISMLSLIYYCEVGQKYFAYFEHVNPLMPQEEIVRSVFLNMYEKCNGDLELQEKRLAEMESELLVTAQCQVKRLRLISRQDAFINAIVGTHTTTRLLLLELHEMAARMQGTGGV